ncbi:M12 family metallopeptidase [Phaeobacter sp. JH20_30]|uniref:M12 family metallopeptidase n=2 Tax=unclassified Phaeobacter TaxID=2621772 RepID=UPI003A85F572
MMKSRLLFTALMLQGAIASSTHAHSTSENEVGIFGPPEILEDEQQLIDEGLGAEQSVVDQFKVWEAGQTLKVCFYSGQEAAKQFFVDTANVWDEITSISFDFGTAPSFYGCSASGDYHIRVALAPGGGNWSYVGTDSAKVSQAKPSLRISMAEPFSLISRRSVGGTILHELGHALGLKHEHQSPEANCEDEIDWDKLYAELAKPPNKWDKDKVDHNLRPLVASQRLRTSEYDAKSIMHYALPASWFKQGSAASCYIKKNTSLSDLDVAAAEETYPSLPQKQDDYLNRLHSSLAVRLEEEDAPDETLATLSNLINAATAFVPDREVDADLQGKVTIIGSQRTSGDCSPIINDAGDVTITCN